MRSWVIGRGVDTFSISRAMALASYTPTQIGSTVLPFTSFKMTMGMLVTGSIMRPRIFISTSMRPSAPTLHHSYALAHQGVRPAVRDPHHKQPPHQGFRAVSGVRKIERAIVRGAPDPLPQRFVPPLHQDFPRGADQPGVAADLDGALTLLQRHQAALLLLVRNDAGQRQRRGVGAGRVFEAEQRIVLHLTQQVERLLEVP